MQRKIYNHVSSAIITRCIALFLLAFCSLNVQAQVTTNSGSGLAANYGSLSAAITALNGATISSPVVITLTGNETAPAGTGYYITASGTSTNTITIEGSASTITAGVNSVGGNMDAVFKIVGGDYITIQNFTIVENTVANTVTATGATNTMTEAGVLIIHASATDGAQNNTIQNNVISLSAAYPNSIGIFSTSSSTTTSASPGANSSLDATSTAGTNSGNKIFGNTISSVAYGIMFVCPPITNSIFETGNDIGGSSLLTKNTITYGVNTASSAPWNRASSASGGVVFRNGAGNSIRFNTINTIGTFTLASTAILISSGTTPAGVTYTSTISDNTITMTNTGTTAITGIDFGHGISTGTILSASNTITLNSTSGAANSGALIGIKANYSSASNSVTLNAITFNQSNSVGSTTSPVTGINSAGIGTTVNVNNNTIIIKQEVSGTGSFGSGAITYIDVSAGSGTVNVNLNNLLTTGSTIRSTGTCTGVSHTSGTITVGITINQNMMVIDRVALSGTIFGTSESSSPSTVAHTITNNTFTFSNLAGTTIANGIRTLGGSTTPGATVKNVNSNTISITGTNTGQTIGIILGYSSGNVNGNTITVNNSSTDPNGIWCNQTGAFAHTISSNIISLTSNSTAPTSMLAIRAGVTGPYQIFNNSFPSLSFTGIITGTTTVAGISLGAGTSNNVYDNVVNNMSVGAPTSTSLVTMNGILINGGTLTNIYKNKVYGLTTTTNHASALVNGITISAGTTNQVYNNLIGDLNAPSASSVDAIRGINITSTTGSSTINVYYNTIQINATSVGANFGTTGIFHTTNTTATTATLNLRNNVISNTSTAAGAGLTVAFRRSSGAANTLANYGAASNNNMFYAGTPSATNLLYSDGTSSAQTISGYKSGVFTAGTVAPRDANSASEDPGFQSTSGASPDFLKFDVATPKQIESGAVNIGTYTTDFAGTIRQGNGGYAGTGSAPDMGAWELEGITNDLAAPAISYTALSGTCSTADRILVATISDASGVPTVGSLVPRVYYNKNGNSYFSSPGTLSAGTSTNGIWTFNISESDMGGVAISDVIYYYVIAEDVAPIPNITSNPAAGLDATDVNTVNTHPTTPSSYLIQNTLVGGTYTVGSLGFFTTLTDAITAYNTSCLSGPIVFELEDASYIEAGAMTIAQNAYANAVNTLTIRPAASVSATISASVNAGPVLKVLSSYVTIDGSNNGTTSRDLTITNTSVTTPNVLVVGSSGVSPISFVTIKNSILINGTNTSSAVFVTDGTSPGAAGYFNNISVENNDIQRAYIGLYVNAVVAAGNGNTLLVSGNSLNTAGANSIRLVGIYVQGVDGATVSNNVLGNMATSAAESPRAIWLATGTINATVSGNTISGISLTNTGAFAAAGIYVAAGASVNSIVITGNNVNTLTNSGTAAAFGGIVALTPNTNITNNTVSGMTQNGAAGFWGVILSGGSNCNVSGNTVSGLTTATTGTSSGINIQGLSTGVNVFNNRVSNIKNTHTTGYGSNGIQLSSTSTTANVKVYNNFIWDVAAYGYNLGAGVADNGYGIIVTSGAGYGIYFNTVNMNTNQTVTGLPAAFNALSGLAVGAIDLRNNIFVNSQTQTGEKYAIYSGSANTVFSNINNNNYRSVNGTNLGYLGSSRATLTNWQTATGQDAQSKSLKPLFVSASNLHLSSESNCGLDGAGVVITGISTDIDGDGRNTPPDMGADEFTASPSFTASSGSNSPICAGSTLNLTSSTTATNTPVTYAWTGPNSFSNTTQNPNIVSATVAASGPYTITVTDAAGCIAMSIVNVTVNPVLVPAVSIAITAGSQSTCAGSNVTFTATPTNGGASPNFNFKVNGFSVQNGASATYSSLVLANNDAVTCEITSNALCATPTTASSNSIVMTVNSAATPTITVNGASPVCGSLILDSSPAVSYLWSNGATTQSINVTNSGNYTVTIVDNNGCTSSPENYNASITPCIPCATPGLVSTSSVTAVSANLNWDPTVTGDYFTVRYWKDGDALPAGYKYLNVLTTPAFISGLLPNTLYHAQVKTICTAGAYSLYSNTTPFTTLVGTIPCIKPFDTRGINIGITTATVEWNQIVIADSFRVRYAPTAGGAPYNYKYKTVSGTPNVTSINLTGLTAGTEYIFSVQSICLGVASRYSNNETFTTDVTPGPAPVRAVVNPDADVLSMIAYPNPTNSITTLKLKSEVSGNYTLTISDIAGRKVSQDIGNMIEGVNSFTLDFSNLQRGVYLVTLKIADKSVSTRVVVQ